MRLPRASWLLLLVLFLRVTVTPSMTHAQTNATLRGKITDLSGAAVANATIEAQALDSPAPILHTQSDLDGSFTLTLAPGRYRVTVTRQSFARVLQEFTFTAGEVREWDLQLTLATLSSRVIVTDTATPESAQTTPDLVDVITRDQIDQQQQIWLTDILATQQGVAYGRLGPFGGITSFFLDGGDSNYTKFLVDGTPINEPGGYIDLSNLTLESVDKIEIVHGATSALHGLDAMDGVVQIFTHRGTSTVPELMVQGDGGTFDTGHGSGQLSGLLGPLDYSLGAGYFSTGGQGPGDYFRDTTLSGNFGWRFSDTDSVRLSVRNNASGAGQPGQTLLPDQTVLGQYSNLLDFSANFVWNAAINDHWQNQLEGFEWHFKDVTFSPLFPPAFVSKYNTAGFNEQSTYSFHEGEVTAGYEYEVEIGPTATRHNQAGYLEAQRRFGRLTAIVGARVEANSFFGTRTVPRLGASYALREGHGFWGATRLRAAYGQGIVEPEILPPDCSPALQPEQSRTVNGGVDQYFSSDRVRISITPFYNQFRDIISFASGVPMPNCPAFDGSFFNTEKARAFGANSAFDARVTHWLQITGNYSYDDSKVLVAGPQFDPSFEVGNRLFRRPLNSANLIANVHFWRTNWNLSGHYVGRRADSDFISTYVNGVCQYNPPTSPCITSNPGYVRWDFANSVDWGHGFSTIAHIGNLFDKHYQDAVGYPALGYNYRVGVKYTWGGESGAR
jgi:outer membrane cobalamin receptor